MMGSRLNGENGGRSWWTLGASAALALVLFAAGCGGVDQPNFNTGDPKQPMMKVSMTVGPPSPAAANTSQAPSPAPLAEPPPAMLNVCKEGGPCAASSGCISGCNPATSLNTMCAGCDDTGFTNCTQIACQFQPQPLVQ